ncbi:MULTISPECIES: hypothetical protein [Acetobacter]|uniref:Uncharacterized protein n=2 Tax=Acetobacter TaxID=434 RepID=A0A1Y0VAJ9_9PROT|nr:MULTISPECIES: hypothetical protein [Acetobacter]RCL04388.1 hypothetical protein BBA71_13570 [Acetobacter pasteurianus]GCD75105.1 hypothetical protein NBRC3299_1397 [Acetobacter pasteurianus NBRC 3299]ARW11777.1 hypothetical protein S101447_02740 [Acetobacter ascendens]ARW11928.1 hypothetical protein S101447_02891 [Acetobacter ascendens]KAA8386006.1 hypothetical protein FKW31_07475 [Acetobacter sp. DmW_136]
MMGLQEYQSDMVKGGIFGTFEMLFGTIAIGAAFNACPITAKLMILPSAVCAVIAWRYMMKAGDRV